MLSGPGSTFEWTEWGEWGSCEGTCGDGRTRIRERTCEGCIGPACAGDSIEGETCYGMTENIRVSALIVKEEGKSEVLHLYSMLEAGQLLILLSTWLLAAQNTTIFHLARALQRGSTPQPTLPWLPLTIKSKTWGLPQR